MSSYCFFLVDLADLIWQSQICGLNGDIAHSWRGLVVQTDRLSVTSRYRLFRKQWRTGAKVTSDDC